MENEKLLGQLVLFRRDNSKVLELNFYNKTTLKIVGDRVVGIEISVEIQNEDHDVVIFDSQLDCNNTRQEEL